MNFFLVPRNVYVVYMNFDFKNGCKMNLMIITKNHAADPEIGFVAKSISKPNGCATAMPTAWELRSAACGYIFPRGVNGCRLDSTQTG